MHDLLSSASGDPVGKYMKHLHSPAVTTGTYTPSIDSYLHTHYKMHRQTHK